MYDIKVLHTVATVPRLRHYRDSGLKSLKLGRVTFSVVCTYLDYLDRPPTPTPVETPAAQSLESVTWVCVIAPSAKHLNKQPSPQKTHTGS